MRDLYHERITVEYTEPAAEGCEAAPVRKEATLDIYIDLYGVVQKLGRAACINKGGVSRDGFITVKRIKTPGVQLASTDQVVIKTAATDAPERPAAGSVPGAIPLPLTPRGSGNLRVMG